VLDVIPKVTENEQITYLLYTHLNSFKRIFQFQLDFLQRKHMDQIKFKTVFFLKLKWSTKWNTNRFCFKKSRAKTEINKFEIRIASICVSNSFFFFYVLNVPHMNSTKSLLMFFFLASLKSDSQILGNNVIHYDHSFINLPTDKIIRKVMVIKVFHKVFMNAFYCLNRVKTYPKH